MKEYHQSLTVNIGVKRSADVLKKGCYGEDDDSETATDVINEAINEEMVLQSTKQGLPIIPFPCPNFVIVDKNFEDTKVLIRENSYKDLEASVHPSIISQNCDISLTCSSDTRKVGSGTLQLCRRSYIFGSFKIIVECVYLYEYF